MEETYKKAIVGVFDNHAQVVDDIKILKKAKFPMKHLAVVGEDEGVKEIKGAVTWEDVTIRTSEWGAVLGAIIGALLGIYIQISVVLADWQNGLIGAFAGAVFGSLIGNILGAALGANIGTEGRISGKEDPEDMEIYDEYIQQGKYVILVHGPEEEVALAKDILKRKSEYTMSESMGL